MGHIIKYMCDKCPLTYDTVEEADDCNHMFNDIDLSSTVGHCRKDETKCKIAKELSIEGSV